MALKSGQYDVIEAMIPAYGMNQNISPESLPENQSFLLENIQPLPLGEGRVRFGTKALPGIMYDPDTNPTGLRQEQRIIEVFDYSHPGDGRELLLLYVSGFEQDTTANTFEALANNQFTFKTQKYGNFAYSERIKIEYENLGTKILESTFNIKAVNPGKHEITLLSDYLAAPYADSIISKIYYESASIYQYDYNSHELTKLYDGMATNVVPRSVFFESELLICNGANPMLRFNGDALTEIKDFVFEQADNITRLDNNNFSFTITEAWEPLFKIESFQDNKIQIKLDNVANTLTANNAIKNQLTITVTTNEALPASFGNGTKKLYYQATPPAFSYLHVLNDRLYALGEGNVKVKYRSEPLKVYFTYTPNSIENWFNETTKQVSYIDISSKHGITDQLEAISSVQNDLVLFGRKQIQIWSGNNPLDATNFLWKSTIKTGLLHGNLLRSMGNDIYFVSPNGLTSLSTVNVAQEAAVSSLDAMNPSIQRQSTAVLLSDNDYRKCRSFHYRTGAFAGFKIGSEKTIIVNTNTQVTSFSVFSGAFQFTNCFLSGFNRLFMADGNSLLEYGDGRVKHYNDNGKPILCVWALPYISDKSKRFACKRYDVSADYSSDFIKSDDNALFFDGGKSEISIHVFGDWPRSYQVHEAYPLEMRGDLLDKVPLAKDGNSGFRFSTPYANTTKRLQFTARSFWVALRATVYDGYLNIKKVRLYGRKER